MAHGGSFEGRVLGLPRELLVHGHGDLAAALLEVVTKGGGFACEADRALFVERLHRIAAADRVAPHLREEAAHLADLTLATDPTARRGGTGQIWIAWDGQDYHEAGTAAGEDPPEPGYHVSWQAGPGEDWVEDGPYFTELRDALTWARDRTDRVVVRPSWDQDTYYWAGLGPNPHEFPPWTSHAPDRLGPPAGLRVWQQGHTVSQTGRRCSRTCR